MFARVTTAYIRQEMIDKFISIFEKSILPAAKSQKGYVGAELLLDRETGKGSVITYWETEADAIANEESKYYEEQLLKVLVTFLADPIREGYEVVVSDP